MSDINNNSFSYDLKRATSRASSYAPSPSYYSTRPSTFSSSYSCTYPPYSSSIHSYGKSYYSPSSLSSHLSYKTKSYGPLTNGDACKYRADDVGSSPYGRYRRSSDTGDTSASASAVSSIRSSVVTPLRSGDTAHRWRSSSLMRALSPSPGPSPSSTSYATSTPSSSYTSAFNSYRSKDISIDRYRSAIMPKNPRSTTPPPSTSKAGPSKAGPSKVTNEEPPEKRVTRSSKKESLRWKGMCNFGNNCYMNSILQCLFATKDIYVEFIGAKNEKLEESERARRVGRRGELVDTLAALMRDICSTDDGEIVGSHYFKKAFEVLDPRFDGDKQHDAQEFFASLLNQLQETTIPSLFTGYMRSTLRCACCNKLTNKDEKFTEVSLPVSPKVVHPDLVELLRAFTAEEVLGKTTTCSYCSADNCVSMRYTFMRLPKYLVIHLKRYSSNGSESTKDMKMVEYPKTSLDMKPYMNSDSNETGSLVYNLYGVCSHVGTMDFGHYLSTCKHPISNRWAQCNDAAVFELHTPESFLRQDAYVLFYERATV